VPADLLVPSEENAIPAMLLISADVVQDKIGFSLVVLLQFYGKHKKQIA
jgi:hypothetical protein